LKKAEENSTILFTLCIAAHHFVLLPIAKEHATKYFHFLFVTNRLNLRLLYKITGVAKAGSGKTV
jgi:hypothetical protein